MICTPLYLTYEIRNFISINLINQSPHNNQLALNWTNALKIIKVNYYQRGLVLNIGKKIKITKIYLQLAPKMDSCRNKVWFSWLEHDDAALIKKYMLLLIGE